MKNEAKHNIRKLEFLDKCPKHQKNLRLFKVMRRLNLAAQCVTNAIEGIDLNSADRIRLQEAVDRIRETTQACRTMIT